MLPPPLSTNHIFVKEPSFRQKLKFSHPYIFQPNNRSLTCQTMNYVRSNDFKLKYQKLQKINELEVFEFVKKKYFF